MTWPRRTGPFNFTADYFRIDVSDRIGITSNFTLENDEIDALLVQGVDAARDLKRFRFFTNAFATRSQGIDLVSTFTPIALRGNTVISAVFNYTDTEVTGNDQGLLNDRRLTEFAYALPRTRWNISLTQRMGRMSFLGRVNYLSFIIIDPAGMVPLVALRRTKKPGSARAGTCRDHAINGPRSWTTQSRGTPAIDAQRLNWLRRRRAIRSGGGAHPLAATRRLLRSVMVGA